MKIKISLVFLFLNFYSVFSQQELIKEIKKQTITIDSLSKIIKMERENYRVQNETLKSKTDSIIGLKSTLSKLDKFKNDKNKIEGQLKQKNDSISILKKQKSEIVQKISDEKIKSDQYLTNEKEKYKAELLNKIAVTYKDKKFDDLIASSTKMSVERDIQLLGENNELNQVLNELKIYFEAKTLLEIQFNTEHIKTTLIELNKIKQQSVSLEKLKYQLENYQLVNNKLIECLNSIKEIDKKETVMGMDKEIKQLKFDKILNEISKFVFDSDFKQADYPYLSDILFQVIKLKIPNPDTDITNFSKKIE